MEDSKANKSHWTEKAAIIVFAVLLVIAMALLASSVSFDNHPLISPNSTTRPDNTDDLVCTWNASADSTSENVTWFNGSAQVLNDTDVLTSTSTLPSAYTLRGESWTCQVVIGNGTDSMNLSTNVTIKNAAPTQPTLVNKTSSLIENQTVVYEDVANNFTLASTDPDDDTVTYGYIGQLPQTGSTSFDSNTGVFIWTPVQSSVAVNITFYATDNYGGNPGITAKKVQFNVTYVNDAPTFSPALSTQNISEGEIFNYAVHGSDEEGNIPLNISMNVNPSLDLEISAINTTSSLIQFQSNRSATYSESGNYTVSLNITDSLNASAVYNFTLEIISVNLDPVLDFIPMYNFTQGQYYAFNVTASDPDDNATLNFSITSSGCLYSGIWNITTTNSSQNATGLINLTNVTNEHVVCRNIHITVVDDKGAEDSQDVFLNISNTNDPPIVEVLSFYSSNTAQQQNITNLTAYANAAFTYRVNASDPDTLTYEGETLTYSDNATIFNISSSDGEISFTPSYSDVGNQTINITVTDDEGLYGSMIINFTILNNSAPTLNRTGNVTCYEDVLCTIFINASDPDSDNLTFTSNDTGVFNIIYNSSQYPVTTAIVNLTGTQSQVGNHSVLITVADPKGSADNETILVTILNTNDAPQLVDFSFPKIVETFPLSLIINANDEDYQLSPTYEYVNFSIINNTGGLLFNISTLQNASNHTYGQITYTPQIGDAGNYSVNVTATDYYGLTHTVMKNFTILAKSQPPNITYVNPYGTPLSNYTIFAYADANSFTSNTTDINLTENMSVTYVVNATDELPLVNISFTWYVDGSQVATTQAYNATYPFTSPRTSNITVIVGDEYYENVSFTWNATIADINRAPSLINDLLNITANGTTVFNEYFMRSYVGTHFIDPDDDLDGDLVFDINETSTLSYNSTSCSVAELEFENQSLRVRPTEIGNCTVTFTALDYAGLNVTSNEVLIITTEVSNETTEVEVPQPTSGGGGSSRSSPFPVPITKEDIKPQAIEIVVPDIVTVYENKTVVIPVMIQNTWNSTLYGIQMNVSSVPPGVSFEFSEDYFNELRKGETQNLTLSVFNYRMGEDYELKITGNVTDPDTDDAAYVFLNTIEQSEAGKDVETKVTFAQDLLNQNPECMELNELLAKAKDELNQGGDREEISHIVDGVIEGCKYLVSVSKKTVQKPETIVSKIIKDENRKYLHFFLGLALVITAGVLLIKRNRASRKRKEEEEKKAKQKEEEEGAYW
ncbi:hypothetical protein JW711_05250 [Candidatus Woesearchaeota archaeon]|nr:hypothetical protein [Candidatus Woesearchaeota archaeon]